MRLLVIFSFLFSHLLFFPMALGQDSTLLDLVTPDSTQKEAIVPIATTEIAVKSTEANVELLKIKKDLLTTEQLETLNNKNKKLVENIKADLEEEPDSAFLDKSPRYLDNRINYWNRNLKNVDRELEKLNKIYGQLENTEEKLVDELALWESTLRQFFTTDTTTSTSNTNLTALVNDIKALITRIENKKHYLNMLLDRTGLLRVDVNLKIETISSHLKNIEDQVFASSTDNIFSLDFKHLLENQSQSYVDQDSEEALMYLKTKVFSIVFYMLLTLVLVYFFKRIGHSQGFENVPAGAFYLNNLNTIIKHYISTGLLTSLIVAVFLFKDPPVIVSDVIRNLLLVPSMLLSYKLLPKAYIKNLIGIVILLLLHQYETSLPADSSLSRVILLILGVGEVVLLVDFLSKPKKGYIILYRSAQLLGKTMLVITVIGLIGNVFGAVILAQITLTAVIKILNTTITLGLASIIFNGVVTLGIRSPRMNKSNVIRLYGEDLKRKLVNISNTVLMGFWVYYLLKFLFIEDLVIDKIASFFAYAINIGAINFSIGNAVTLVFIIWVSTVLARLVRILLKEDILSKLDLDKGMPHSIATMVQYTLVVLGVIVAISAIGMPLDTVTIILGAMSVGIGFGLQNIFNNLVSGLILLFERPIQLDDIIEVGNSLGHVKSIGIRSSNVRTVDGAEVIIPNGDLISKDVVNWTLSDQKRRVEVKIGISYASDPHQAKALFESLVEDHPDILKLPKPVVLFDEFGDSSLNFRILFWTSNIEKWLLLKSEITFKVFDILKENNIEIPFPQRDVHIRTKN